MMKLAVDLVIRRMDEVLFIKRKNDPFKGMLALPGGFVDEDESVTQAAIRELFEETGVRIEERDLRLIGVFSDVNRDPRGRVISVAYNCQVLSKTRARAGDDAAEVIWLPEFTALQIGLAFDHALILLTA
jgi:8-oxo-dGTP diphosphatase